MVRFLRFDPGPPQTDGWREEPALQLRDYFLKVSLKFTLVRDVANRHTPVCCLEALVIRLRLLYDESDFGSLKNLITRLSMIYVHSWRWLLLASRSTGNPDSSRLWQIRWNPRRSRRPQATCDQGWICSKKGKKNQPVKVLFWYVKPVFVILFIQQGSDVPKQTGPGLIHIIWDYPVQGVKRHLLFSWHIWESKDVQHAFWRVGVGYKTVVCKRGL